MFSPFSRHFVVALALLAALASVAAFVTPADASGSKKRDPTIAIRFHAQEAGYDPTFAAKVKVGNPPQEITVEKIPMISEKDIVSFYPYRASDGSYSAVLKLDRHGEATLEAISSEKRGSLLVLLVNGRPIMSILIDKIIRDGIIFIPSGLTEANIKSMGASFSVLGQPEGKPGKKAPPAEPDDSITAPPNLPR